jgi:phosphotransferase system  glucose/maltose/N-acetylglucosamine-specific IIC component
VADISRVVPLLVGLASLLLWAVAALLVGVGVSFLDEDTGVAVFAFAVALLAVYPGWLFARSAVRIRRAATPEDREARRYTLEYGLITVVTGFATIWQLLGLGLAVIFAVVTLVVVALSAATDFEPRKKGRG